MSKKDEVKIEFKGLMVLKCPDCGKVFTYFSKESVDHCYCKDCKTTFTLENPVPLVSYCECGNRIRSVTNCKDSLIEFNCKCGYPLVAEYSVRKNKYLGMR